MADIQACTDHGCIYGHPGGMGTNGGCRCLYELPLDKRRRAETNIRALRAKLEAAERDAERYRWFRTHENWRDGGPYDDLYEEELDAAIDAARGNNN